MIRRGMPRAALLALLSGLSACGTITPAEPPMSQDEMKGWIMSIRRNFKDPDSIRDTSIGQVFACHDGTSCVCMETNARNGFGGLTGLQRRIYVFRDGSFAHARETDPFRGGGERCEGLFPWPEFDGGYKSPPPAIPKQKAQKRA